MLDAMRTYAKWFKAGLAPSSRAVKTTCGRWTPCSFIVASNLDATLLSYPSNWKTVEISAYLPCTIILILIPTITTNCFSGERTKYNESYSSED
jgi:hypothetical protein